MPFGAPVVVMRRNTDDWFVDGKLSLLNSGDNKMGHTSSPPDSQAKDNPMPPGDGTDKQLEVNTPGNKTTTPRAQHRQEGSSLQGLGQKTEHSDTTTAKGPDKEGTFARRAPGACPASKSMFRPSIPRLSPCHTELGVPSSQSQKHKSFMHDWKKWWRGSVMIF